MAKPIVHAKSSARKYGGTPEDYLEIHMFMDSSKSACSDNRHRALTHNSWFLVHVLERVKFSNSCEPTADNRFPTIKNSEGRIVSVRDIGEQHILEDFGNRFIPTVQDYFEKLPMSMWMNNGRNGTFPPSYKIIAEKRKVVKRIDDWNTDVPPEPISHIDAAGPQDQIGMIAEISALKKPYENID